MSSNKCLQCGKETSNKKFCSSSCAATYNNSRRSLSDETKAKIRDSVKKHALNNIDLGLDTEDDIINFLAGCFATNWKQRLRTLKRYLEYFPKAKELAETLSLEDISKFIQKFGNLKTCKVCGSKFHTTRRVSTCSEECNFKLLSSSGKKGGKKSAYVQRKTRRSKNEILFGDLCKEDFINVKFNENIFNGWDADIIIPDKKIAILWNGNWHYIPIISEKYLNQVKNRDKIKIKEIEKAGYKVYIVEDRGKYNPKFVIEQYKLFQDFLNKI